MTSLEKWEKATNDLAIEFVSKYFCDEKHDSIKVNRYRETELLKNGECLNYFSWVGGEVGGCLFVSDDYFNLDRIVEALRLNAGYDDLVFFSDYELLCCQENVDRECNFSNFVKYPEWKEKVKKHYKKLNKKLND